MINLFTVMMFLILSLTVIKVIVLPEDAEKLIERERLKYYEV